MKVGFFTSIEGWGGSEMYLGSLISGVRERGNPVVLFGIRGTRLWNEMQGTGVPCVDWRERRNNHNSGSLLQSSAHYDASACEFLAPTHSPPARSKGGMKKHLLRLAPRWVKLLVGGVQEAVHLRNVFRQHSVDVMHINVSGYEMAGIACRLVAIPCVGVYCTSPEPEPWWVRRMLIRSTARAYTLVVGKTMASLTQWRNCCPISLNRSHVVWNGIDVERYAPASSEHCVRRSRDMFHLLAVGRLHKMKGFNYLLEAMSMLTGSNVTLAIAGSGEEETALRILAQQLGIERRVRFLGHVQDVDNLYHDADAFVMPSVSHESFGNSLAEAMASGLPVITSDFGPLPEINLHGVTGLTVPSRDSKRLAEAIACLNGSPELCGQMGAAGRLRAQREFSRERMVRAMVEVYGRAMAV